MARKFNFNPGPAALPQEVLQQAQEALFDFQGVGTGIMEISHRSKPFEDLLAETKVRARRILGLPDSYHVLFCQGGARTQFAMVPMNFLDKKAAYVDTGTWSAGAIAEASLHGEACEVASSKAQQYNHIPPLESIALDGSESYLHLTSNNTIYGTQWHTWPETGDVPLVVDMSSDIASRPVDLTRFDLIYAGAQKNLGPAGVTLVFLKDSFAERARFEHLPRMLRYDTYIKKDSLYNTPPVWNIFVVSLVLQWIEAQGGLDAIGENNRKKMETLYQFIDENDDFFKGTVQKDSRSWMNITFRLPSVELEKLCVAEADKAGFMGIKGHRIVGGIRVSNYNAVPLEGITQLIDFLKQFASQHG